MTGRYKGTPMQVHAAIADISGELFDRWLALFRETSMSTCPPAAADLFCDRAQRIAQSLELGIAVHRRQMLGVGERLRSATPELKDDQSHV